MYIKKKTIDEKKKFFPGKWQFTTKHKWENQWKIISPYYTINQPTKEKKSKFVCKYKKKEKISQTIGM